MIFLSRSWRQLIAGLLLVLLVGGCASTSDDPAVVPPMHTIDDLAAPDAAFAIDVHDPFESTNRNIYKFNALFDKYLFLPIVEGYRFITPEFLRDRVSDFWRNISNITTFANQVLQWKPNEAGETLVRFSMNVLGGVGGLFDTATALEIPQHDEDFGQTLGHWGAGDGPFIVLPIFGPSNLRDTAGLVTDTVVFAVADPFYISTAQRDYPAILALQAIDARHVEEFRYFQTGSPFEYELLRLLYTEKRRLDIRK